MSNQSLDANTNGFATYYNIFVSSSIQTSINVSLRVVAGQVYWSDVGLLWRLLLNGWRMEMEDV
jgi:predicted Zn-dependent protease